MTAIGSASFRGALVLSSLAMALAACSDGGSTTASAPPITPPPAPAPPPPPPPPAVTEPYRSPFLANSLWPVFHGNNYATASVARIGPGDVERVETVRALTDIGDDPFVSPWTVFGGRYADGSQPILTTPNDGVAKYLIRGDRLETVDFLQLERNTFDFDWALLVRSDNSVVVTERRFNRIVIVGDAFESPFAALEVKRRIEIDEALYGPLLSHHSLAPDGTLIASTEANKLIAVDLDAGAVIASFDFASETGASFQNSFPIDETGRIFVAAQGLTVAVDWDGTDFTLAWSAPYDMRGPGCESVPPNRGRIQEILAVSRGEPCTGTGTTPSLIGSPETGVFVIVDGHAPQNNLVAFWRDQPPSDWQPLPDPNNPGKFLDRRVAGVLALPLSTPEGDGFTAQNSPAVLGNSVVVAQWAGFNPGFDAPSGVQRVDWFVDERRLELVWTNPDVLFNGVPLIACINGENCRTYGAGRYGARYEYVSLDLETGEETGRVLVDFNDEVLDQGNGHAIADDGSIVYAGKNFIIRVR